MARTRNWSNRSDESLGAGQRRHLRPLGLAARIAAPTLYALIWLTMRGLFRLRVHGREHLPDSPLVFTPNHTSYLDPFALCVALGYRRVRQTYWAGWAGILFRNRLTRLVTRLGQAVPIDPQGRAFSSLGLGAAVLRRRRSLVWFPEGCRSPSGELQDLKPGVAALLPSFDVELVPVYIHGAHAAMPVGCRVPRIFRPIHVVFGEPLPAAELAQRGRGSDQQSRILEALTGQLAELSRSWASPAPAARVGRDEIPPNTGAMQPWTQDVD